MPLIFAVPVITGLIGLFAGAQVDNAVTSANSQPSGSTKMPWQVSLFLLIVVAAVVFYAVKKFIKKI